MKSAGLLNTIQQFQLFFCYKIMALTLKYMNLIIIGNQYWSHMVTCWFHGSLALEQGCCHTHCQWSHRYIFYRTHYQQLHMWLFSHTKFPVAHSDPHHGVEVSLLCTESVTFVPSLLPTDSLVRTVGECLKLSWRWFTPAVVAMFSPPSLYHCT